MALSATQVVPPSAEPNQEIVFPPALVVTAKVIPPTLVSTDWIKKAVPPVGAEQVLVAATVRLAVLANVVPGIAAEMRRKDKKRINFFMCS